ncbi:MAG: type II secretion system protein, partial [Limisphaerales bacterium]
MRFAAPPSHSVRRWKSGARATARVGGFSLIEMIGVLAIMALCAAILTPNVAQRVGRMRAEREERTLATLGEALTRSVVANQVIPGAGSWAQSVAAVTGLSLNEVLRSIPADSTTARVYLIHPSFKPSTMAGGGFADPLWTQGAAG